MTNCGGCLKVRRTLINKVPKRIAAPLAKTFLPTVTDAAAVVREARSWVGVPFRHQGRDRSGIDCWGLPVVVLKALGAMPEDFDTPLDYPPFPHKDELTYRLRNCTPLPDDHLQPGVLVSLAWHRTMAHVAIYTDTNSIIHAFGRESHMAVIEHGYRGMWRTRYTSDIWALPGVRY